MREKIKTIVWDLDNTLYKFTDQQVALWHSGVCNYMVSQGVGLNIDDAMELAHKGWVEHRDSNHYFIEQYNINQRDAHVGMFAHIDKNMITPCAVTPSMMNSMRDYRHIILTYATSEWAHRILDHTNLAEFFQPEMVFGAEHYDFEDKASSPRGILMALDKIGGNADEVMFVEDTLPNLQTAKTHSDIITTYLHHDRPINDNDMSQVDLTVRDTPELLKWFKEVPAV